MEYITYKKCSNKKCKNPNKNKMGYLPISEFYKYKSSKDGFHSTCKSCQRYYRTRHKTTNEIQQKGKGQYRSWLHCISRRTTAANATAKLNRGFKKTQNGNGNYDDWWGALRVRTNDTNAAAKTKSKGEILRLTTKQTISLMISQNYKCPITGIDLIDDFVRMSPDHIVSFSNGGDNNINNIIWIHSSINHGKNGDEISYIIDLCLRVYYPNDDDNSKEIRKNRMLEIMEEIWRIHDIQSKVYEKIEKMSLNKIKLLVSSKISVIDLLNT